MDFVQGDWNGNGVGVVVHWVGGLKRKGFYKKMQQPLKTNRYKQLTGMKSQNDLTNDLTSKQHEGSLTRTSVCLVV